MTPMVAVQKFGQVSLTIRNEISMQNRLLDNTNEAMIGDKYGFLYVSIDVGFLKAGDLSVRSQ